MRALLIVDMQNDFMPGGPLAVPGGDLLIPLINRLIDAFEVVVASKDWHPKDHVSFQKLWPPHCVQGTQGAEFAPLLKQDKIQHIALKGMDPLVDSYSAFSTDLDAYLRRKGVDELFVVGVATDYCVLHSVLDALELGYRVSVIEDGCKGIRDGKEALDQMRDKGAQIIQSSEVLC